ncbi:MAG: nucleotide-binding protein [Gemmatimonadales bacterium]
MRRVFALLLPATALVGCSSRTPEPPKVPLAQMQAAAPAPNEGLTGPVLEHLSASPYVYLRVKTSKGEVWAAVPEAKIENGAQVTVFNPMLMTKFESKSLKRTFDEVYFGTLTPADAAAGAPAGAAGAPAGAAGANPHTGTPPTVAVDVGKVDKATGADARTVAEVWAQKASLVGKTVTVRGTVVKYNDNVMGKNWIHLQDGSGDAKQGTNDITVTSMDAAARGQTITITGTVRLNRDFGAGYSYAAIIEDAKVLKKS